MIACRNMFRSFIRAERFGWRCAAVWLALALPAFGQVSPEEHAKHHPDQAKSGAPASGGMMQMGSGMMGMGRQAPAELFPSLLQSSPRTAEQRANLERLIHERRQEGLQRFSAALEEFSQANDKGNYAAMQETLGGMRDAVATLESCDEAQQALADEPSARRTALRWFQKDMGMLPEESEPTHGIWGMSWFHFFIMLALIGFAGIMIWMYFHKMRRAANLLQDLTGGSAAAPTSPAAPQKPAPSLPSATQPAAGKWSGKLRVAEIFQETPDVKTFRFMNPLGGALPFAYLPGQFLTVTVPIDGKPVKRSYTIASSPTHSDYAEITVKHEEGGEVSGFLHSHVQPGDLLEFSGPTGSFIFTGRECKCILLIGGGVGITPLMSVIRYLTDRSWPGDIYLLYGIHDPKDFIFREELEYLQRRHPNLRIVVAASHPEGTDWKGTTGRITKELISKSVPDLASRYVHLCGPVSMMEAIKKVLAELGVPLERIKSEAFGPVLGKPEPGRPAAPPAVALAEKITAVAIPTVTFAQSGKSAPLPPDMTVLDAADAVGVEIDNSCRVGTCGTCRVKLSSGQVTMAVEDGLEPGDKEAGIILACQAKATGNVVVEA